jgi:hypothetical protein
MKSQTVKELVKTFARELMNNVFGKGQF